MRHIRRASCVARGDCGMPMQWVDVSLLAGAFAFLAWSITSL